ncbi:MAG: integrin alpha [Planctomycetota bacterium]
MPIRIGILATAATLFASATLLGQGTLYTFHGENAEDRFGISVSGAGDLNNDGFEDVLVGAH